MLERLILCQVAHKACKLCHQLLSFVGNGDVWLTSSAQSSFFQSISVLSSTRDKIKRVLPRNHKNLDHV